MVTKWILADPDAGIISMLARRLEIHPLVARLMVIRGICDPDAAHAFLDCELSSLSKPSLFHQMDKAVSRTRRAIVEGEQIVVYGDYDVDGVTGTSLLFEILRGLGGRVSVHIPDRMNEGYGLNEAALVRIKASGGDLVVSVDCGITAIREATAAASLGLDLIITDHHEMVLSGDSGGENGHTLPPACAVLHPALLSPGASASQREAVNGLTGVGIAFKFAQALMEAGFDDDRLRSLLDLVALGTVADVGRITGENRILVKHGLDALSSNESLRPGIAALKQVAGLNGKKIGVGTVGFTLAPRINASGRLERADVAFRLLSSDSPEEALDLASALDAVNRVRQEVEESITDDAKRQCRLSNPASLGAIVLSSETWHPGVIGIVSSRLADEFYRPTALISVKQGLGKGSARSIPGFDLYEGLRTCSDLLLGFGGHKYAAGFTVAEENISRFRERLNAVVLKRIGPEGFVRTVTVDGSVTLDGLTIDLVRELEKLAPFGRSNPEPRLGAKDLEVTAARIVGSNHLKCQLRQGDGKPVSAIAFNRGGLLGRQVRVGARLAIVFTPRLNVWNGTTSLELEIRDVKAQK